jgi:hypothetical protein
MDKPSGVPVLVKHCALAIYRSGDVKGSVFQKIYQAMLIARSRLTEYGFLLRGSELGGVETIKLASKGLRREVEHLRESGGRPKTELWDKLYALIEGHPLEELLGKDEEEKPVGEEVGKLVKAAAELKLPEPVAVNPRDAREAQRRHRLVKAAMSMPIRRAKRAKKAKPRKAKSARRG